MDYNFGMGIVQRGGMGAKPPPGPVKSIEFRGFSDPSGCWTPPGTYSVENGYGITSSLGEKKDAYDLKSKRNAKKIPYFRLKR